MTQDLNECRKELQRVLDTYGADRDRWPAHDRPLLDRLLETDALSRRTLAEARALDRVLDSAPLPQGARMAGLADRIMAAAAAPAPAPVAAPVPVAATASILPWRRKPVPALVDPVPVDDALTARTGWQAAGLIAACLLAGIYIGAGSNVLPLMEDVAESVGIVAVYDPNTSGLGDFDGEDSL